jgi:hypothetical protein
VPSLPLACAACRAVAGSGQRGGSGRMIIITCHGYSCTAMNCAQNYSTGIEHNQSYNTSCLKGT